MLDCTDVGKLIDQEVGNRRGFILLSLLTKLHLECLKQIQSDDRSKFPQQQEEALFKRIESEVQGLRSSLVQLDAEHLKLIELALIDYKILGDIALHKQHLVEFLSSSYKAISEIISKKEITENTFDERQRKRVNLLEEWKEIIQDFNKDKRIEVISDKTTLDKVKDYLNVRRNADSLYKIYSAIDSGKKYFEIKGTTIDEKRLVLQIVLQKVGEYLKSTSNTPSLSGDISESLEKKGIPVKFLSEFRDRIAHYQIFPLELNGVDIRKLFYDGLGTLQQIIHDEIIGIEKGFIQRLVQQNVPKITNVKIKEMIGSYGNKGAVDLINYIDQIKDKGGAYYSLNVESKRLVDEIYEKALQMKSRDLPLHSEEFSKGKLDTKKLEIIKECIEKNETKVSKKIQNELRSWNIDQYLDDVSKIEKVVDYLQHGIPTKGQKKLDADGVLNNFLGSTNVLSKINIFQYDQWVSLKDELEKYFDLKSFRDQLPYSEFRKEIKKASLVKLLNSINVGIEKKRSLLDFLSRKTDQNFIEPGQYEELVNKLDTTSKNKQKLLMYSVALRKKECIDLLEKHPPAFKKIIDHIIEGKAIPEQFFKNLAYQYKPKDQDNYVTEKTAKSLQQSIESKVGDLYLKELEKKINALKTMLNSDAVKMSLDVVRMKSGAVQMQFVIIYSLLERTRKDNVDPFVIRMLRNHVVHSGQSDLFREQFLQLMGKAIEKIDVSKKVTLSSFNKAVSDALSQLTLLEIKQVVDKTDAKSNSGSSNQNLNFCVRRPPSRQARSVIECLFSKDDVEKFSKGKIDENNVDKVIIDSEKFLTYVKSSQDEGKNAQLIMFIGDKSIEGNYKYLVDRVVQEQGYERYIQNERIRDLHGGISQMETKTKTKTSKLKGRLINAAGRIQLIRGIHGIVVSCKDGTATDCGLSMGGMAWSFASQSIENVIVKTAPKLVQTTGRIVGKIIPGTLGRQAQFAVTFAGVKVGSKVAKGVAGGVGGLFDIIDIGRSASNLVDCKKRESSDNPCSVKEVRDEIVSISFSGVSFVAGVALTAVGMPVVGIAVGFGLMVTQGVYSGISNIVEYEEKYDTTSGENWSIFWRTLFFQDMAADVRHLADRKNTVNSLAQKVWSILQNDTNGVFAYGVGLGKVRDNTLHPDYANIIMRIGNENTINLSRIVPDYIEGADMICLPKITNQDYEKGITSNVPAAQYHCENAIVLADKRKSMQSDKIIVFDLRNVNSGNIRGSNEWNNNFLIFEGSEKILGGSNTVNRFVLTDSRFAGQIIMGPNSTNVFDLSQIEDSIVRINTGDSIDSKISQTMHFGNLIVGVNRCVNNYINAIGRQGKVDVVSCSNANGGFIDCNTIVDCRGGKNDKERDIIENCERVVVWPNTNVKGQEGKYFFYIKSTGYKSENLYSEIDVEGTGVVIFPENDLLNDCDEVTYSSHSNTLSLRLRLDKNNQYSLDIKNYRKRGVLQPSFILIDKNGSNVVPRIKEFGIRKINSFELHSEYSLDNIDDVETHYKKILSNNKKYEVFTVIRGKAQSQDNGELQKMFFGSLRDDIINLDEDTIFAKGGEGSDVYFISDYVNCKVKIDNNSDDRALDAISLTEVPEMFLMQGFDLYLDHNGVFLQVKNYLKDNRYRHLMLINNKGESFIPFLSAGSSEKYGKLVPFFHATPTQNMFVLPKDFQGDSVVIDSLLEEIEKYKDKDDLLLVREVEMPFIIRIEDFYNDLYKWEDVNFLLWNDGNFSPYFALYEKVSEVMDYQDKLKNDYRKIVKEYVIDFSQSINITHNQENTLISVGEDEKRIGVMILKNITPDRIQVFSSDRDLVFSDNVSNNVINIKNWNSYESYRISMLEFNLGLEPLLVRGLDRFSLFDIAEIRSLVNKASEVCRRNDICETNIEAENCNIEASLHCAAASGHLDVVKQLAGQSANINAKDSTWRTPLHYAAANGKLNVVRYLIEEKRADVNVKDKSGLVSLHYATKNGRLGVVKYLIEEKRVDVNVRGEHERTPLHYAAGSGKLDVVKYLIEEKRADVNVKDNSGHKSLHLAAFYGMLEVVKYLMEKEADVNVRGEYQRTPLHYAAGSGKLDVVKYLIEEKRADVNVKDNIGQTSHHLAAFNGTLEVVEYLIEKGADVDVRDAYERTPLHLAAFNGGLDVVKYLIREWGDFNGHDQSGKVALHYAAESGKLEVVEYLLEKGAVVDVRDAYERSALHYAAKSGKLGVVKYLLKQGAYVDAQDSLAHTPLYYAVERGKLEVMKYLIEKGADVSIKSETGEVLLHNAAKYGKLGVVECLIEKGVNLNAQDEFERTPLHYAAESGELEVVKYLIEKGADVSIKSESGEVPLHYAAKYGKLGVVEYLIEKGVNLNAQDNLEQTPLHYAAESGKLEVVKYLIKKGADVRAKSESGEVPLHYAAKHGNRGVVECLIEKGVNLNVQDNLERTPLHYAAERGELEVVKYLAEKGANLNVQDNLERTPLHYAAEFGELEIIKCLVEKGANLNIQDNREDTPLALANDQGYTDVANYLREELDERKDTPKRRNRRHHHGDHNHHHMSRKPLAIGSTNQTEIATSSGIRPSLWINSLLGWVKSSVSGLFYARAASFEEILNTTSSISQVDAKMDVNGTIMLLDVLVRKFTDKKYISEVDQYVPLLEARGYALNITRGFEIVVEQAGLKSGVSMHGLNIDCVEIQKEVARKIMSGKFNEISGVLSSYVEKAYSGKKAEFPGKLSSKKFDKFMLEFNNRINVVLNRSIQQILYNGNGTLEVDGAKIQQQQMSFEPRSYFKVNASVEGHSKDKVSSSLSNVGVTKPGNILSK